METTETPVAKKKSGTTPMEELANYHQQIEAKYQDLASHPVIVLPSDVPKLIPFNGYYALGTAPGAFFAIDTNVHISSASSEPIYVLDLLVSLDGTSSQRFPFTGLFDGTNLVQNNDGGDGLALNLVFSRIAETVGITASFIGTITLPGQSAVEVLGNTYNNPIPVPTFAGEYYETVPFSFLENGNPKQEKVSVPVMQINENFELLYDDGSNAGNLQPVSSYTYNMNMYFFSFTQGTQSVRLIMGTAAAGGLVCNNMVVNTTNGQVTTRSVQTIPFPKMATLSMPNINSAALAAFSGYYQLPSLASGAFLSIQAQYVNALGDDYVVMIAVSLDGKTSKGFYFEAATMIFENNTLYIPDQSITLTFNRAYDATQDSLATVTGTIGTTSNVSGYTLFNPVPLSVFGGVPMKNAQGVQLTVVNDNEVIYKGKNITTPMTGILYVPLMYILAYPSTNPTVVMSFGTDGLKGNTCIITDNNGVYVVSAIA